MRCAWCARGYVSGGEVCGGGGGIKGCEGV